MLCSSQTASKEFALRKVHLVASCTCTMSLNMSVIITYSLAIILLTII